MQQKFIEFETKYEVEENLLHPFKELMDTIGFKKFLYVQGPDVFFTKPGDRETFARYRRAEHGDKREEFTIKQKHDENSSIIRTETNWLVTGTPANEILKGIELMGFVYNTKIWKACHIYNLSDATLVFYTVRDENNNYTHFIEVEVKEQAGYTEEESWEIIRKYEELLKPLGISAQKRKRKSLFEMYRREDVN